MRGAEVAELAFGAQAQPQIAIQLPLLAERQAASDFTMVEVIGGGIEVQVAERVTPEHAGIKTAGKVQSCSCIRVMFGSQCGQQVAGHIAEGCQVKPPPPLR